MPQTRLSVGSMAATIQLSVAEDIVGVRNEFIKLKSPDGKWYIKVPRENFNGMLTMDGDLMLVSLTLTRIVIEEEPDLPGLGNHKIIHPGKAN